MAIYFNGEKCKVALGGIIYNAVYFLESIPPASAGLTYDIVADEENITIEANEAGGMTYNIVTQ